MGAVSNSWHRSEGAFLKTSKCLEREDLWTETARVSFDTDKFSVSCVFLFITIMCSYHSYHNLASWVVCLQPAAASCWCWDVFYHAHRTETELLACSTSQDPSAHILLFSVWAEFKNAQTSQEHDCVTSLTHCPLSCSDVSVLSERWASLHSWRLNRSGRGVTATLTLLLWLSWSNVSLLKKTNAESQSRPTYYVVSSMLLV